MRPPCTPLLLLLLLNAVPAVRACLQCDRTISLMHDNYILSLPDAIVQATFMNIINGGHDAFRETSLSHKGVIDLTTLYRARTEYQSEFNRFTQTTTGTLFEAIQIMEKGKNILKKHLEIFIVDGLCPNKCGLLVQRVVDCMSCRQRTYNCPSPTGRQDCGENRIEAEEGGQAMLDCFLPWHRLLIGKPEYYFSWAPASDTKETREFQTLVVTRDSFVVLNQLHVDESGTYQCLLQNQTGTLFYKVTFILSVTAVPIQIPKPPVALPVPALHSGHNDERRAALVVVVSVITALSLVACLGLTVVLRSVLLQRKEPATRR
uniref:Ig-like domain-containing protein n=1 Tax=Knipowitschia caucasica TaxID=637954 RepID=A0AAV2MNX0_KNICA